MADDFEKDPDAVLDWHFDWAPWLEEGETIIDSTFIVTAGLTKNSESYTSTNTTVWLAGGRAGYPYDVTNRVTTSMSRIDDRTITIRVTNR